MLSRLIIALFLLFPTIVLAQTPPTGFEPVTGVWTQAAGVAAPVGGFAITRWATPFGPNQQAACVIGTIPDSTVGFFINFRMLNASNRYRFSVRNVPGQYNDTAILERITDNVPSTIHGPVNLGIDIQPGDKIGINVNNNAIDGNFWSLDASWNEWKIVAQGTAITTPALSYIGMGAAPPATCDQFLGQGDAVAGDTTPPTPSPPTGLALTVLSDTSIGQTSDECFDDIGLISYSVKRCEGTSCTPVTVVRQTEARDFTFSGLTANTTYGFSLRCYDGVNFTSESAIVYATTFASGDTTPPTPPTKLHASRISGNSLLVDDVTLTWVVATDVGGSGVARNFVERGDANCANFVEVFEVGNVATATDSEVSVPIMEGRCYRVRAQDVAGNIGDYSDSIKLYPASGGGVR